MNREAIACLETTLIVRGTTRRWMRGEAVELELRVYNSSSDILVIARLFHSSIKVVDIGIEEEEGRVEIRGGRGGGIVM